MLPMSFPMKRCRRVTRPENRTATECRVGQTCFSPRQQLAHGLCVQAFRELVDEDQTSGDLDDTRKAAWGYVALAIDKLLNTNSLLCRWHTNREVVAGTFDSHDFGMKWSYTEMAVTIEGLGLDWALDDLQDCIKEIGRDEWVSRPVQRDCGTGPS